MLNLAARFLNLGLGLLLARNERGTFALALLDDLREFADALLQRRALLAERRRQLLVRRERDLAFCQGGIRLVTLLPEIFQFHRERGDLVLSGAFARFKFVQAGRERLAFLQTFLLLRGKTLHFKYDCLDFLVQQAVGILQRLELALARGNGNFLLAQFRLRLLQTGLQFRLLAQQRAALAARLGDEILQFVQFSLKFGNLVFTAENGTRCLAVAVFADRKSTRLNSSHA